jgi:hypothetical protein
VSSAPSSAVSARLQIHMIGAGLATAMSLGRVYLLAYAPGTTLYSEGEYCGANATLDSCYFLPLSGCSLEDAGYDPAAPELTPEHDPQEYQDGDRCATGARP